MTAAAEADRIAHLNSHGPLARLGGQKGLDLWHMWEANMAARADHYVGIGLLTLVTSDTNKHGTLPDFGRGFTRVGGVDIDLIGKRPARGPAAARVQVLGKKVVNLEIDGHNGHGSELRVTFPSGRVVVFWLVQANLGRHESPALFEQSCRKLLAAFGRDAVYGFDEIDEADRPNEHEILRRVFSLGLGFEAIGWGGLSPTLVGPVLAVRRAKVTVGCPGLAKVSPARDIVETVLTPPKEKS